MPVSEICLIVALIFAFIFTWPRWPEPAGDLYRWSAFGVSWFFFILWLVLGHGGVSLRG
jgi:hypothetical protein